MMIDSDMDLEILDHFRELLQKLCNKHLRLNEKKEKVEKIETKKEFRTTGRDQK